MLEGCGSDDQSIWACAMPGITVREINSNLVGLTTEKCPQIFEHLLGEPDWEGFSIAKSWQTGICPAAFFRIECKPLALLQEF